MRSELGMGLELDTCDLQQVVKAALSLMHATTHS